MKPRLQDILETIQIQVANAIQAGITAGRISAPPAQVVVGWPTSTEVVNILSQGQYMVSVYPLPDGRQTSRYPLTPFALPITDLNVTLTATISGNTLTFGGSVVSGLNIHTFVGVLLVDAYYQTIAGDTLATVATQVQDAINALAIPGVGASSSTNSVTISGSPNLICNIGSSGTIMGIEINRIQQSVQVSGWFPEPIIRYSVIEPIIENIGTMDIPFIPLSDGTPMRIQNSGRCNFNTDQSQSSYSMYEFHLNFEVEFGIIRLLVAAQVESVEQTTTVTAISTVNPELSATSYTAGGEL